MFGFFKFRNQIDDNFAQLFDQIMLSPQKLRKYLDHCQKQFGGTIVHKKLQKYTRNCLIHLPQNYSNLSALKTSSSGDVPTETYTAVWPDRWVELSLWLLTFNRNAAKFIALGDQLRVLETSFFPLNSLTSVKFDLLPSANVTIVITGNNEL